MILLLCILWVILRNASSTLTKGQHRLSGESIFARSEVFDPYLAERGTPVSVNVSTNGNSAYTIPVMRYDGYFIAWGDIVVGEDDGRLLSRHESLLSLERTIGSWPCPIPYFISHHAFRATIEAAINHWEEFTDWRFVERNAQTNYLNFIDAAGCWSYVGMIGGRQPVGVNKACGFGSTVHEIGHAIGLLHEHTRIDRDSYVRIHWDNIWMDSKRNFLQNAEANDIGPYDFGSIMHYKVHDFALNRNLVTIEAIDAPFGVTMGQRNGLSTGDIAGAKARYIQTTTQCGPGLCTSHDSCPPNNYCRKSGGCEPCLSCLTLLDPIGDSCDICGCVVHESCPGDKYCNILGECKLCELCATDGDAVDGSCESCGCTGHDVCASEEYCDIFGDCVSCASCQYLENAIDTLCPPCASACEDQCGCTDLEYCTVFNACKDCSECPTFNDAINGICPVCGEPRTCDGPVIAECTSNAECDEPHEYCSTTGLCRLCSLCDLLNDPAEGVCESCSCLGHHDCDINEYCDDVDSCFYCDLCGFLDNPILYAGLCPFCDGNFNCDEHCDCEDDQYCSIGNDCWECESCVLNEDPIHESCPVCGPSRVCPVSDSCTDHDGCTSENYCRTSGDCEPCTSCNILIDPIDGSCEVCGSCSSHSDCSPTTRTDWYCRTSGDCLPCFVCLILQDPIDGSCLTCGFCTSHDECSLNNYCVDDNFCAPCLFCDILNNAVDGSCDVCVGVWTLGPPYASCSTTCMYIEFEDTFSTGFVPTEYTLHPRHVKICDPQIMRDVTSVQALLNISSEAGSDLCDGADLESDIGLFAPYYHIGFGGGGNNTVCEYLRDDVVPICDAIPGFPSSRRFCYCVNPTCTVPSDPRNGHASINASVPAVVSYICDSGYVLFGAATRLCQSDGSWAGSSPVCACERPSNWCTQPGDVYQNLDCDHDGAPDHACYGPDGRGTIASQADCSDTWPTADWEFDCLALVGVWTLGPIDASCTTTCMYIELEDSFATGFPPLEYTLDPSSMRICDPQVMRTVTSISILQTISAQAGSDLCVEANFESDTGGWTPWYHVGFDRGGDDLVCEYLRNDAVPTCDAIPVYATPRRFCYCVPPVCIVPPDPINGRAYIDTSFPVEARYLCHSGYVSVGELTRMCQSDGSWAGSAPTCALEVNITLEVNVTIGAESILVTIADCGVTVENIEIVDIQQLVDRTLVKVNLAGTENLSAEELLELLERCVDDAVDGSPFFGASVECINCPVGRWTLGPPYASCTTACMHIELEDGFATGLIPVDYTLDPETAMICEPQVMRAVDSVFELQNIASEAGSDLCSGADFESDVGPFAPYYHAGFGDGHNDTVCEYLRNDVVPTCDATAGFPESRRFCYCVPLKCAVPHDPINGRSYIDPNFPVETSYFCHSGYVRVGEPKRLCQTNGSWTGSAPTCAMEVNITLNNTLFELLEIGAETILATISDCGISVENIDVVDIHVVGDRTVIKVHLVGTENLSAEELLELLELCVAGAVDDSLFYGASVECINCPVGTWTLGPPYASCETACMYIEFEYNFTTDFPPTEYTPNPSSIKICDPQVMQSVTSATGLQTVASEAGSDLCDGADIDSDIGLFAPYYHVGFGDGLNNTVCEYLRNDLVPTCDAIPGFPGSRRFCYCIQPKCTPPPDPSHGRASVNASFPAQALYFCDTYYVRVGEPARLCQSDGSWAGSAPICVEELEANITLNNASPKLLEVNATTFLAEIAQCGITDENIEILDEQIVGNKTIFLVKLTGTENESAEELLGLLEDCVAGSNVGSLFHGANVECINCPECRGHDDCTTEEYCRVSRHCLSCPQCKSSGDGIHATCPFCVSDQTSGGYYLGTFVVITLTSFYECSTTCRDMGDCVHISYRVNGWCRLYSRVDGLVDNGWWKRDSLPCGSSSDGYYEGAFSRLVAGSFDECCLMCSNDGMCLHISYKISGECRLFSQANRIKYSPRWRRNSLSDSTYIVGYHSGNLLGTVTASSFEHCYGDCILKGLSQCQGVSYYESLSHGNNCRLYFTINGFAFNRDWKSTADSGSAEIAPIATVAPTPSPTSYPARSCTPFSDVLWTGNVITERNVTSFDACCASCSSDGASCEHISWKYTGICNKYSTISGILRTHSWTSDAGMADYVESTNTGTREVPFELANTFVTVHTNSFCVVDVMEPIFVYNVDGCLQKCASRYECIAYNYSEDASGPTCIILTGKEQNVKEHDAYGWNCVWHIPPGTREEI